MTTAGAGRLIHVRLGHPPPTVARAKGVHLWDRDGRRYLDASSGAVAATIGHGVPEVVETMRAQAATVAFAYRSQFTSEPAQALADRLAGSFAGELPWVFFVNSGSEAVETALRLAVQSWREAGRPGKTRILSRRGSYHGITLGALGVSGFPARRANFEELLRGDPDVALPYCDTHGATGGCDETCGHALADDLRAALERHGPEHVAAFVAEPIIGAAAGAVVPPPGYYQRIRELCDRAEVFFIADEVMTGVGRTGTWWGIEHWTGVRPDVVVAGKGLSGGYTPIAAVAASERVLAPILAGSGEVMAGHTMSANPLSTAVGTAVWDYVEAHDLVRAAATRGDELAARLERIAEAHPAVREVRGRGLLRAVSLGPPHGGVPGTRARELVAAAFDVGLLLYPATGWDDAVLVAPPLTITDGELEELDDLLRRSLASMSRG